IPNYQTFYASDITENGFTANWAAVDGANQYNILVKKASDSDYSNPAFQGGSLNNRIKITGLTPGTSYHFQVQSKCSSGRSAWSKGIATPVKTKPAAPQEAKLRLSQAMGFLNGTNMEVGKSYRFRATVENHGNKPWRG
ncbi:fibronectin type III domain-containing protein, partial [Tannerella forsythia]|uniref:fibronectin type III domain-containing protein n=1 Tax=Tannerella forsythia TaxID=28112 RepID=UPI001639C2F7